MRFIAGLCLAALCAFAAVPAAADMGAYPQSEQELQDAYDRLTGTDSHATIQVQAGLLVLLGADAERYSWLGSGAEYPATEAVLIHNLGSVNREVYYEWYDEGYVSDSDWEDVDNDALLIHYRDAIEGANEARAKDGRKPMHVVGWLEPPHYDKSTSTVIYAIEMKDKNGSWANAVALRLGRSGYTMFNLGRPDRRPQELLRTARPAEYCARRPCLRRRPWLRGFQERRQGRDLRRRRRGGSVSWRPVCHRITRRDARENRHSSTGGLRAGDLESQGAVRQLSPPVIAAKSQPVAHRVPQHRQHHQRVAQRRSAGERAVRQAGEHVEPFRRPAQRFRDQLARDAGDGDALAR